MYKTRTKRILDMMECCVFVLLALRFIKLCALLEQNYPWIFFKQNLIRRIEICGDNRFKIHNDLTRKMCFLVVQR